jgi:hypothetical protein
MGTDCARTERGRGHKRQSLQQRGWNGDGDELSGAVIGSKIRSRVGHYFATRIE